MLDCLKEEWSGWMPEGADDISALAPLTRMGERVASSEAKIEALREDTRTIRSSIHTINGEIQKMVILEERCAASLKSIEDQNRQQNQDIRTLLTAQQKADGAIWATARIASVVVTLLAGLAVIVGAIIWGFEHLRMT